MTDENFAFLLMKFTQRFDELVTQLDVESKASKSFDEGTKQQFINLLKSAHEEFEAHKVIPSELLN